MLGLAAILEVTSITNEDTRSIWCPKVSKVISPIFLSVFGTER